MNADQVRSKIDASWQELVELVSSLDHKELATPNQDGWAIKDHMIHIGAWEHWLLALFQGRDKLEAMGAGGTGREVDDVNAVVWELHKHDSVDAAWRYFRNAHEQLAAELAGKTTEDFERSYSTFFTGDSNGDSAQTPVLEAVAANTYDHYAEHIGWIKEQTAKQGSS
jgi:hypothetical protein